MTYASAGVKSFEQDETYHSPCKFLLSSVYEQLVISLDSNWYNKRENEGNYIIHQYLPQTITVLKECFKNYNYHQKKNRTITYFVKLIFGFSQLLRITAT